MSSYLKPLVTTALLATLLLGTLFFWLISQLDWQTVASRQAPEGRWVATHLRSTSEAGDAPYGDHLVLAPAHWPLGQYYGEVVFAGYCTDGLAFSWVGAHQLRFVCATDKVMKMVDAYKEVRIQHANVSTAPEAKTPMPSH